MPETDSIDWIHLVIFFFSVSFIVGSIIWMTWLGLGQRFNTSAPPPVEPTLLDGRPQDDAMGGSLGDFMVPAFILYSIIDVLFLFIAGMELIFTISPLVRKWYRMNQKLLIENHEAAIRSINANVIEASENTALNELVDIQATIPCITESTTNHQRQQILQEHSL